MVTDLVNLLKDDSVSRDILDNLTKSPPMYLGGGVYLTKTVVRMDVTDFKKYIYFYLVDTEDNKYYISIDADATAGCLSVKEMIVKALKANTL